MGRKPTPTKAKASKSATTSNTKASPPTLPDVIEPKPDRVPNPLLTDPAIHAELQPLRDALVMVAARSRAVADCCGDLLAMKQACGMPKAGEWPDSPTLKRARARHAEQVKAIRDRPARRGRGDLVADYIEPRWTELMREWCGCFRDWCAAIATAKELAASPAVAALMNAGESRPAQRWTARTMIELDNLARTLHPVRMGEDGMGFIREGLRPLAPGFHACIEVVRDRIAELRSIPVAAAAPIREDEVRPTVTRADRRMEWLSYAMVMVNRHPEWSDAAIAKHVGIDKSRLSRAAEYQAAAHMARTPKTPAGSVRIANGNRELEAVDDSFDPNRRASRQWQDEEDTDARLDREIDEAQRKAQRGATKPP
jgi:hypothetical protein